MRLRLLTLNMHKGFSALRRRDVLHSLRDAVRATVADIVCLQEVAGAPVRRGEPGRAGAIVPQYEFLADTIWHQHAYGRNAVSPHGHHHGNALLSRYPIVSQRNVDVSHPGDEQRGLLHCVLEVPRTLSDGPGAGSVIGAVMHVICVHLGLRETHRERQIDQLFNLLEHDVPRDAPLVVAGDFNDWRSRSHRRLVQSDGFHEVHEQAQGRVARTFPARHPFLALDRIYVRNLRHRPLALPRRPWSHLSDHTPLAVEVTL